MPQNTASCLLDRCGEGGRGVRVVSNFCIEERQDYPARLFVPRFCCLSVPPVQRIVSVDRCVEVFPDHSEGCEVAMVHLLDRDEISVGVAERLNGCKV